MSIFQKLFLLSACLWLITSCVPQRKYAELENNVDFLEDISSYNKNVDLLGRIVYNDKDVAVFNFGKHKGKSVVEIFKKEQGYYGWMMKGDFPLYTKKVLKELFESIEK